MEVSVEEIIVASTFPKKHLVLSNPSLSESGNPVPVKVTLIPPNLVPYSGLIAVITGTTVLGLVL